MLIRLPLRLLYNNNNNFSFFQRSLSLSLSFLLLSFFNSGQLCLPIASWTIPSIFISQKWASHWKFICFLGSILDGACAHLHPSNILPDESGFLNKIPPRVDGQAPPRVCVWRPAKDFRTIHPVYLHSGTADIETISDTAIKRRKEIFTASLSLSRLSKSTPLMSLERKSSA